MVHIASEDATEEWRPVVDWEGWYEVSNLGRVKRVAKGRGSYPGRVFAVKLCAAGYPVVGLSRGDNKKVSKLVHSLVAEAFIGPRPLGYDVNHIDANKTNATSGNLEYVTRKENMQHASRLKLWKNACKGEAATNVKLTTQDVRDIRVLRRILSQRRVARLFDIDECHVYRIVTRKAWSHVA